MSTAEGSRRSSYGQASPLTAVDRFGVWLSLRRLDLVGPFSGKVVGDFGCGYEAAVARGLLPTIARAVVVDLALSEAVRSHPKVTAIEGLLPSVMSHVPDASLDIALCLSVLEHLWEPQDMLTEVYRVLRPGGKCLVNVPSWAGKRYLELSAFRLHWSPLAEMDDHKRYYDPKDLWPMLVRAGFAPHAIRCHRHKFRLNTVAICRKRLGAA